MKPMLSKAWSCSTLGHGLDAVERHYKDLCENPLSEEDMKAELAALKVFCHNMTYRPRAVII